MRHFKDVRSVALITGLLAVVSGVLQLAPFAAFSLLLTPAILQRSWRLAGRAFLEGLAIIVVGILMSVLFVFDSRTTLPVVCYCVPIFVLYNPAPDFLFGPISYWILLGFVVYTGICYYRLAAIASPAARFPSKIEAALAGTFLATVIFRASWFSHGSGSWASRGVHGEYPAYFFAHLVLALSWAVGGWVVMHLIAKTVKRQNGGVAESVRTDGGV